MRERVCKNCGGREYKVEGQNMIKCKFCGTLYVDEHASKEEEFLLARANELLRACKFDDAVSEYENILEVQPMSYSAYFGKALAKNKIVLYSNKRGSTKRPRFFGSKICSLKDDSDFKKALELAPSEDAKFYNETARRVEKVKKQYEEKTSTQTYDVFMSCVGNEEAINVTNEVYEKINSQFSVYFFNKSQGNEEEVFQALKTCKVFLLFALAEDGYLEDKNLYDRYLYFISQKQKVKSSFVIVANLKKVNNPKLPKDLLSCKSAIDMSSISFIQDLQFMLKTQIEKNIKQTAKIETVKIESVKPKKKEYVDVENVTPSELGNYKVENLTLTDSAKLKWLFLSIKNGDYNTAKDLIEEELSKDENNSEVLFAQLLVENGLRTQEQFFSSIKNFDNKEKISKILKYASKDFAEFFVDSWEKLLIKLNSEEYFNEFLLYLAGFSTPNREEFVAHAESLAVESLNKELIEKVLKCFGQEEVDRYIKFYFLLAQKSDDPIYYQKILELDTGHFQSNMAMLMQHFKSIDDILNYQNREELEQSLKYFNAKKRGEFVIAIVDRILPVAFFDLTKAENQLDFYLAYITEQTQLLKCCEKIFVAFKDMGFFKLAEKYLSIQISKEPENAKLYWELIKIKAHCKSDNELIISDVKIMQMPEWETLLELSDDAMGEYYANIVSKQNLYKGERKKFEQDMFGRVALQEKLKEFILRNQNILLEMEKQEGNAVKKGVDYYRLQLEPFEKYCESLQTITTFEEFLILNEKIKERLKNLDLNFESSVNVLNLKEKHQGLEKFQESEIKTKDDYEKKVSQIKKQNFLKKYLCIFLEFFPLCFTSLLLLISNFAPKEVYMYFSQDFLVLSLIFSVAIAMLNLALFVIKKSSTKSWKAVFLSLFGVGAINLVLFCSSFYFVPNKIQIYNAKELSVLLTNAKFADFVLKDDIDLANINLKGFDFYGIFDGEGHEILNINTTSGGLFKRNGGFIKNLNLHYKEQTLNNTTLFGGVADENQGTIKNCIVSGKVSFELKNDSAIGGLVGTGKGGNVQNCWSELEITILDSNVKLSLGGLVGEQYGGKKETVISQNCNLSKWKVTHQNENINFGGLIGILKKHSKLQLVENVSHVDATFFGTANNIVLGGLVGYGESPSENNYSTGKFNLEEMVADATIGGLYGVYQNTDLNKSVEHCYSTIGVIGDYEFGGIVGKLGGRMKNNFATASKLSVGEPMFSQADMPNCVLLKAEEYYPYIVGFDTSVWVINQSSYPTLVWQNK